MKTKKILTVLAALATLAMSACTSDEPAAKPQPQPAEIITGRSVFQKVFISARGWQADVQPFRLVSQPTSDANGHDGVADVWLGSFASPATALIKTFAWSGTNVSDAPSRGVTPGTQDGYSASNSSTHIFNAGFLKTDSDQAFQVAQKHGGEKVLTEDPKIPVFYALDWSASTNKLIWHVVYGADRGTAKLAVSVDATTGDFIRVEK
ncbi:MAG TPA: hypothetical protein VGF44_03245 [Terriglobales bacterium]